MSENIEDENENMPAKKNGPLMSILIVANLAVTGFVGYQVMDIDSKLVKIAKATGVEDVILADKGGGTDGKDRVIAALGPFVVNLNEEGRSRYLKAQFEIEVIGKDTAEVLEAKKAAVHDDVLRYLSGLAVSDTLGASGKETIGNTMKERIDKLLGGGKVSRLFFKEFVVQ